LEEKISTGLLGKKGELLVTNRLLKDYEVFFPYFDRGVDLIVKKKDQKRFFTIQCRTRDFRGRTARNLTMKKNDFERMRINVDFLVFVVYRGERDVKFLVFPISWLQKIVEAIAKRRPVEKNYILRIKCEGDDVRYERKGLNVPEKALDISRFAEEKGWEQLK